MRQLLGGTHRQVLSGLSAYDRHHIVYGLSILSDELDLRLGDRTSGRCKTNSQRTVDATPTSTSQAQAAILRTGIEPAFPEDDASDISNAPAKQAVVSEAL